MWLLAPVCGLTLTCSVPSPETIETGILCSECFSFLSYSHGRELRAAVEGVLLSLTQMATVQVAELVAR